MACNESTKNKLSFDYRKFSEDRTTAQWVEMTQAEKKKIYPTERMALCV